MEDKTAMHNMKEIPEGYFRFDVYITIPAFHMTSNNLTNIDRSKNRPNQIRPEFGFYAILAVPNDYMKHPYKSQLLLNLKVHYHDRVWRSTTYFESNRDEILFVLPKTDDISSIFNGLYDVLAALPEIDHPKERVVISFCYDNGEKYCSRLINPTTQDEINLALIGYRPERKVRPEEIQALL